MEVKFISLFLLVVLLTFICCFLQETVPGEEKVLREEIEKEPPENEKTILLVGDIMLNRGVEYYSQQEGDFFYPFRKISRFLKESDTVLGNLEGPIIEESFYFEPGALRFVFKPETASALASARFNLISLANNHTHDKGKEGLEETKELLAKNGISSFGDPVSCSSHLSFSKDDVVFWAVNKTFPFNCSEQEIIEEARNLRLLYPQKFLIVVVHWGNEYENRNSSTQKRIAHILIDEGADLVVGHHPHVIQNIEEYKDKLIFYSLGNFIFDQDFSLKTQQGLVLKINLTSLRVVYHLIPIHINRGQPCLMGEKEAEKILIELSRGLDRDLSESIREGIIEVER